MVKKCREGYKKLNGSCEKKSKIPFLTVKEADAIRLTFFRAILILGGWGIFWGIVKAFRLNEANPVILIIVGVVVTLISVRFAIKKD